MKNGNFELTQKPADMNETVMGKAAIPEWEISGFVEYIKAGQKQGVVLLLVPEGTFAVHLGNGASIKQRLKFVIAYRPDAQWTTPPSYVRGYYPARQWARPPYRQLGASLPQQFGVVCGNDSSQSSMYLHSRYLPRPSVSSPLDNRARPMANINQAPDLEGLYREIHSMAEQMRAMNENNAHLIQLFAMTNPPPPAAPPIRDIERSHHSRCSGGDHSQNHNIGQERREQHRSPSLPRCERSSSLSKFRSSSKTPRVEGEEVRRGRSPRRNEQASKADNYVAAEELAEAKHRRRGKDDHKRKEPDTWRSEYRDEVRSNRSDRDSKWTNKRCPRTPPRRPELILSLLNAPIAQVLIEIKHEEFIKWPRKIKTDPRKKNKNKYCEFH
ncbi:hypothetical protein Acr_00g0056480 [Actinidia rufa]|uniref:DUF642 domain-containing protein n=1 Tax=Actinidia rufa TaxID=165716 RepID=A0A7J0DMS8_9ERIC|nr:hypothetical protein Acr_00g0056480 [Actinidia rufa]